MMKTLVVILVIALHSCKAKNERINTDKISELNGKKYKSEEGNFIIEFPGKPEEETVIHNDNLFEVFKTHSIYYPGGEGDENVFYGAAYDVLLKTISADSAQYFFDEMSS